MPSFGPRRSSVPRYERMFQAIGPVAGASSTRRASLAEAGAQGGPLGLAFAALGEIGDRLVDQDHQRRLAQATRQATLEGWSEAEKARADRRAIQLRDAETASGRAFNQAVKAGYLARMDLDLTARADQLAQQFGDDPAAWAEQWDALAQAELASVPAEWQGPLRLDLDTRRAKYASAIRQSVLAEEEGAANADLITAMDRWTAQLKDQWRRGADDDLGLAAKWEVALQSRTDLSEQQKARLRLALQAEARTQAVLGDFEDAQAGGLRAAERFISDFRASDAITDPDERDKLAAVMDRRLADLRADARAAAAVRRAVIERDLADDELRLAQGFVPKVSEAEIRAAYAGAPATAQRILDERRGLATLAGARQQLWTAPLAEEAAILESHAPDPNTSGYAGQVKAYQALQKAQADKHAALAADPAGFLLAGSRELQASFQAAFNPEADPATLVPARTAFIEASLDLQAQMGVPPHQRRPLPSQQAQGIVQTIATTQGGEAKADAVQGLAAGYGAAWPRVYGQLVEAGLPPEIQVLTTVDAPVARVRLAEAYDMDRKDLRGALDPEDAKWIDAEVAGGVLDPLKASLALAPDGPAILSRYREATTRLAYQYARTMPKDDAVEQAARDVVLGRYDFVVDRGFNARAPAGYGEPMRRHAEEFLDTLLADTSGGEPPLDPVRRRRRDRGQIASEPPPDKGPLGGHVRPGGLMPIPPRPNEPLSQAQRDRLLAHAIRDGTWITNESDDGWLLIDAAGQLVRWADGARVELPFADLGDVPPSPPVDDWIVGRDLREAWQASVLPGEGD